MQELAGEVTFPVVLDHYISGANQTSLDDATIIKEIVEALGTDYITLNIKTYTSSASAEVYNFRLQSWTFGNGWGALYGDPENPLSKSSTETRAPTILSSIPTSMTPLIPS